MRLADYITLIRPHQWLKNLMLFFPPFLGGMIFDYSIVTHGLLPFISFCLAASSIYVVNDLVDSQYDALHPAKRLRPIASGRISRQRAIIAAACCGVLALLAALRVSPFFSLYIVAYLFIFLTYSFWLKQVPVVDLFCISAGFLIRLEAGGNLFHVSISPWLFLSVFLLAVFLSVGKRLSESQFLGDTAGAHRVSLASYPPGFLAGIMHMTGSSVLVTYAMYSLNKPKLIFSVPLCLFGLMRYILNVTSGRGGDPTESLLKDRVLFAVSLLWVIMVIWSIYG